MIYIAIPYSHEDSNIRDMRARLADAYAASLISDGYIVYSPISHWHHIAKEHLLPTDAEFWHKQNVFMLAASHKLVVLMVPDWQESDGLQREISYANEHGIPIEYIECLV